MTVASRLRSVLSAFAAVLVLALPARAIAQTAPPPPPPPKPVPSVVLKVEVVLSRFQGDKKIASLPFTMWVTTAGPSGGSGYQQIRVGVDVPVGTTVVTSGRANPTGPAGGPNGSITTSDATTKVEYRYVGTSIDCRASANTEVGQYSIQVDVQDSSVYTADPDPKAALKVADPMAFRTFSMSNRMTMRDGQTLQFGNATDKVTGETIRVDVTVNVVK